MLESLADFVCDKFGFVVEFCIEKWYWVLIILVVLVVYFMNGVYGWF